MVKKAQDVARRSKAPVEVRQGDVESLQFPDNSFDAVISTLFTCSFYDLIASLKEMRRVCKPDGRILLIEHGRSSWGWIGNYQDHHVHQMIEQGSMSLESGAARPGKRSRIGYSCGEV